MNPYTHFLLPYVISLILVKNGIFTWKLALVCGLVGVIIDIDHFIEHVIHSKKQKLSLLDTWNNATKYHRFYERSFIHNFVGFLIFTVMFLVIYVFDWKIALVLAIAYYSHMFLGYVHLQKSTGFRWKIGKI